MDIKKLRLYNTTALYLSFTASEPQTIEYNVNAKDEYEALITTVRVFQKEISPLSNLIGVEIKEKSTIQYNELYEEPVPDESADTTEEIRDYTKEYIDGTLF